MKKGVAEYKIRFVAVQIISKSLSLPISGFNLNTEFNFESLSDIKVDKDQKFALSTTDVFIKEKISNEQVASFKTLCVFEFPDFEEVFTKISDNQYDIPEELEILLKSTGLSTSRGIIFSELRGTYLHGAIMPLIDIATPIKENRKKALIKK